MATESSDEIWMREAIIEAKKAEAIEEVPIGAVAVMNDVIIARAHNLREATSDPLGHAELLLLRQLTKASPVVSRQSSATMIRPATSNQQPATNWRFTDVTIYVTCEPCLMCAGAMLQARIPRVVFGCADPKAGACGSLYNVADDARLNHRINVVGGCLAEECGMLLSDFFRGLRKR